MVLRTAMGMVTESESETDCAVFVRSRHWQRIHVGEQQEGSKFMNRRTAATRTMQQKCLCTG